MDMYWPTPGFKRRTFKLCVLTRLDFNFCVRSSPLRGGGGGGGESSKMKRVSHVSLPPWSSAAMLCQCPVAALLWTLILLHSPHHRSTVVGTSPFLSRLWTKYRRECQIHQLFFSFLLLLWWIVLYFFDWLNFSFPWQRLSGSTILYDAALT